MGGVDGAYVIAGLLCLVLAAGSLFARRIPLGQSARMAAAWILIFGLMFAAFTFRSEFNAVGQRMKSEWLGQPVEQGGELRIGKADDGHFWTVATVNGREARFLIDSGATTVTLSGEFADELGLERSDGRMVVETANGGVAMAQSRARLQLGSIDRPNMRVMINEQDSTNVLGMNFLSSLRSWRVENGQLVLRP